MTHSTFNREHLEPMLVRLMDQEKDDKLSRSSLPQISKDINVHIKKHYRNEETGTGFFDRLIKLSCYYAMVESDCKEWLDFVAQYTKDVEATLAVKGNEYVSSLQRDRLQNFKRISEYNHKTTSLNVWFVFIMKHILALEFFSEHGKQISEPIYTRCIDIAGYAILGRALHLEYQVIHSGFRGMNDV